MSVKVLAICIGLGLSQAYGATCIKIDCSQAIEKAVQDVNDFVTDATDESKEKLSELKSELEKLDKLEDKKQKALKDKTIHLKQYSSKMVLLISELEENNRLKRELLEMKVINKGDEN